MARRTWAVWLSQDGTRGWSLQTRTNSPQATEVQRDMYRARGFHVRVVQEFGKQKVETFAPITPVAIQTCGDADVTLTRNPLPDVSHA